MKRLQGCQSAFRALQSEDLRREHRLFLGVAAGRLYSRRTGGLNQSTSTNIGLGLGYVQYCARPRPMYCQ